MSRGTTRRSAFGRRTRTVAEQLAVGDEDEAVGPAGEAAVQAPLDERDRAGRRRLGDPVDDADGDARLGEELRQPRRLVGGEDDAVARPPCQRLDRLARSGAARAGGSDGSRQPKGSPDAEPAAGHRRPAASDSQVSSRVRAPSEPRSSSRAARGSVDGQCSGRSPGAISSARRSSAWRHRKSAASATSPGSSRTSSVPAPR